jgi:hypothetical protein
LSCATPVRSLKTASGEDFCQKSRQWIQRLRRCEGRLSKKSKPATQNDHNHFFAPNGGILGEQQWSNPLLPSPPLVVFEPPGRRYCVYHLAEIFKLGHYLIAGTPARLGRRGTAMRPVRTETSCFPLPPLIDHQPQSVIEGFQQYAWLSVLAGFVFAGRALDDYETIAGFNACIGNSDATECSANGSAFSLWDCMQKVCFVERAIHIIHL